MIFKGVVKNGVIVLPEKVKLPDGLEVKVEIPAEFVPEELWDEFEWERRREAILAITGMGSSSGGPIGRQKHDYLAKAYEEERKNVPTCSDEKGSVR